MCAGQRHGLERTSNGGGFPHACHPTGRGVGNTSAPCRDKTGGADAPRGRGKRQITDEATLLEAIDLVLKEHRVEGLLSVTWEKQVEQTTQYVGRGRGSVSREKRVIQKTRYHITHIARQADTIAALSQRLGWKAFVTNAGQKRLSLHDAVLCYRNEYRVERIFNRLKSRVHIAPLFVKLNEQIGPHVPADPRCPGVNGHGVCPATVSGAR